MLPSLPCRERLLHEMLRRCPRESSSCVSESGLEVVCDRVMDSTQDCSDMSRKRSVEDVTNIGSEIVPDASESCPAVIETQRLPDDAARKRAKAAVLDRHPPRISAAFAHDKGSRVDMEDVCIILPSTSRDWEMADGDPQSRISFFAVFDGHGGVNVATCASQELHRHVLAAGLEGSSDAKSRRKAVAEGFQRTDTALLERCKQHQWQDGATCAAVWIIGDSVVVANLGDAKCILGRMPPDGGDIKAITLTREHKAIYPQERARIEKSGGFVSKDGRLGGRIEVSRSFGDPVYKDAGMSAVPDIKVFNITKQDRFLLLHCDGFGVFNPDEAAAAVMRHINDKRPVKNLCERLINEAVRVRRCRDNCSVLAIILHHNA